MGPLLQGDFWCDMAIQRQVLLSVANLASNQNDSGGSVANGALHYRDRLKETVICPYILRYRKLLGCCWGYPQPQKAIPILTLQIQGLNVPFLRLFLEHSRLFLNLIFHLFPFDGQFHAG